MGGKGQHRAPLVAIQPSSQSAPAGRSPAFAAVASCGDMLLSLPLRFRVKKAFSWFWELFVENACSGSMMP